MPVSKKRKKEKTKRPVYFRCRTCGRRKKLSVKGYCSYCTEINAKIEAYAKWLEERGLLPSLEEDPKAYYPRS